MGAPTHGMAPTQGNVGATDRKELNFLGRERHIEVEAGVDADFCNPNQIQIVFGLAKFWPVKPKTPGDFLWGQYIVLIHVNSA